MRAVVTGAGGMLARALIPALQEDDWTVLGLRRADLDVTHFEGVKSAFDRARPDWIFHLAAFTRVNDCETQRDLAFEVNGRGAGNVARAAARIDASVLLVSTDYVFDGEATEPYRETDRPHPLNVYGESKLEGESATLKATRRSQIVRTSWLYGEGGRNFPQAILTRAREGQPLRVVHDQRGSPTWTQDLARGLALLAKTGQYGIFHCTSRGQCSWFEFAEHLVKHEGLRVPVAPIESSELGPPIRPAYSVLCNRAFEEATGHQMPHWKSSVDRYLDGLSSTQPRRADG